MHSYLIVGTGEVGIEKEIEKLAKRLRAERLNYSLKKIEDTRYLNTLLKHSVVMPQAVVIKNIDDATHQAGNAFLKKLEEPHKNIHFILTSKSVFRVLPTIVSRCQIIYIKRKVVQSKSERKMVKSFLNKNLSEKLYSIYSIRKRDEARQFLRVFILGAHQMLIKSKNNYIEISSAINNAQKTLENLRANGNVALQLTNFVISF